MIAETKESVSSESRTLRRHAAQVCTGDGAKPDVIHVYGDLAPPYRNERLRDCFNRREAPVYALRRRAPA
ncbi:hypothetical protein [Phenylobacterium sp.]|uniref:hypothetical protein n=1 Tax=Phenylobacterium sp. TaxID=1871053 RepID=UPI0025E82C59|nr:hypothetical protein [Phenylobacterium sp.]MBX3483753.1 hypothetical protein [Phenylobacterium sp.]MCW5759775.1 hypothetical protein [Phenylobacterium sp.]